MRTLLSTIALLLANVVSAQTFHLFIGTYTGTGSKGIYVYRFDAATGKAEWLSNTDSVSNPSFLALSPSGKTLYACNEDASPTGGKVSAFRFDSSTGRLSLLNSQPTGGDHPCYVSFDKLYRRVVVGNYSGGSVAVFPTKSDGYLYPYRQLIQHRGSSVDTARQRSAHVHATVFSPDGRYLFVPDLGMDKVMVYRNTSSLRTPLRRATIPFYSTQPGSGPRHMVFHPDGRYAYLIEEMAGAITVYRVNDGRLSFLYQMETHNIADSRPPHSSADVHISPDGKFLYASNRGFENTITVIGIDSNSQTTSFIELPSGGEKPRNFCIDPTGRWLLVANQDTNNIVIYERNTVTGRLNYNTELEVPKPVCLIMK